MSIKRVLNILHDHLHMRKLFARWVPRVFTEERKENRIIASERGLEMFKRNLTEFVSRLVTMDESWIHHYTPESSQQTQQSAGKVLASVFWDADGMIFVDYLEH